mmetsp:Transcript_140534/g.449160  ORF Transcript_140534/g.449160 Transcript_140534/m.449160 type:complete len:741 (+) Transcript_140534:666-2888(+)
MEGLARTQPATSLDESLRQIGNHKMVGDAAARSLRGLHRSIDSACLGGNGRVLVVHAAASLAAEKLGSPLAKTSRAESPLDEQTQHQPQRRGGEEAEEELACHPPGQRVLEANSAPIVDTDPELLGGIIHVMVGRDVDHATAQGVVWQHPRKDRLAEVIDGLELRELTLISIHDGGREHREGSREDVGDDECHVRSRGDRERRLEAIHGGRHAEAIAEQQDQHRRKVAPRIRIDPEDGEDEAAAHERHQVVEDVPGIGVEPVHHRGDPGEQLLVLSTGRLLVDQVDDEAGGDEAHGEDHGDGDGEIREDLAAAGHFLLKQSLRLRQGVAPNLDLGLLEAHEAEAGVVPHVDHHRNDVVGLVLEPQRHAGEPLALGAPEGDASVLVHGPGFVHVVLGQSGGVVLGEVLVVVARVAQRRERTLHPLGQRIARRARHVPEILVHAGRNCARAHGAQEHVARQLERRLLSLHGEDSGDDQRDEHEESRQQKLRGPSPPVPPHGEEALAEEGVELVEPQSGSRECLHGHGDLLVVREWRGIAGRLGRADVGAHGPLAVLVWQLHPRRLEALAHALWRPRAIVLIGGLLAGRLGDQGQGDVGGVGDRGMGRHLGALVGVAAGVARALVGAVLLVGDDLDGVAHTAVEASFVRRGGGEEHLLHGRSTEPVRVHTHRGPNVLVLQLLEQLREAALRPEGQAESDFAASPAHAPGSWHRTRDGLVQLVCVCSIIADDGQHVAVGKLPLQ